MLIDHLRQIRLWQFNVATFLATQILFGVRGWVAWAIPAALAWAMTRNQPMGEKNFLLPVLVWVFLLFLMNRGASPAF